MPLRKDIWRPAIVAATATEILDRGSVEEFACHWLPAMGSFRFLADPFGMWRDGRLHVFAEGYDYRHRVGWIEAFVYGSDFALLERGPALVEPWHLSYPFVFEAEGETWMVPEAHKSRRLTFYRTVDFPFRWEPAIHVELDHVPIDATPLFHDGLWWLFYTSADQEAAKTGSLHVAYAERLSGPWRPHVGNPVRIDPAGARPGGTPILRDGAILLPVQDCSTTYGGAIGLLRITTLTPDRFEARLEEGLRAPPGMAPFTEGLHTFSAAGPVTLIDVKRTELSVHGLAVQLGERVRREWRKRRGG